MVSTNNNETHDNITTSTIYNLRSKKLHETPIKLQSATLFSFLHVKGSNNTSNLAYITSENNQYQLNLMDFQSLEFTSKDLSGPSILAVGGNGSQNLFLIQANSIDEYRLGYMDFAQTTLQTQLKINRGTIGNVLSIDNIDYISVYDPEEEELNLFVHNVNVTKYEEITMGSSYLNLDGSNATQSNNDTTSPFNTTSKASSQTFTATTAIFTATKTAYNNSRGTIDIQLFEIRLIFFIGN